MSFSFHPGLTRKGSSLFLRTVASLLRVYPVEGQSTSVELPILTTHLHRSESDLLRSSAQRYG